MIFINRPGTAECRSGAGAAGIRPPATMAHMTTLRNLYPDQPAFHADRLAVGGGHSLYFEQWGRSDGQPALVLHGGPGSGASPLLRRFFDPARYRVISFDQRGSGRSTPRGATRHNHTAALLDDIEALRHALGLERWLVVGGSWGATLGAAYAAAHRECVAGVLLRGLFVPERAELEWFFQGARALFPLQWESFAAAAPRRARRDLLAWLARLFAGNDATLQARATLAWQAWERTLSGGASQPPAEGEALAAAIDRYRVQAHFLSRRCWLDGAGTRNACARLAGLPVQFLHGTADLVCRPGAAWQAQRCAAGSRMAWVPGAGHDPYHPAMVDAMVRALDAFAAHGRFEPPENAT